MTTFEIERLEPNQAKKEVFFSIKVNYETSVFTYGKWLSSSDATAYFADPAMINAIIEINYLNEAIQFFLNNPPADLWHDETCLIQIEQGSDDCLEMLEAYPEIGLYRKQYQIETIREINYKKCYTYVNYILEAHYGLLEYFGCEFNVKAGYHLELQDGVYVAVAD